MIKTYIETRYIKPMAEHYFFVEDLSGEENTLSIVKKNSSAPTVTVEYSTDERTWQELGTTSTTALTYNIPANGRVYLKANANSWGTGNGDTEFINSMTATANYSVGGNILSLLYGSSFAGQTVVPSGSTSTFKRLFQNCTTLVKADNLILPEIIPDYGLLSIFSGCSSLTTAPDLSNVTSIGIDGLSRIFFGCTALTGTIDLSGLTTIGNYGMAYSFYNCSSLVTAPDLSNVTTIDNYGMESIFSGCSSLATAPDLSNVTSIGSSGMKSTFQGCNQLQSCDLSGLATLGSDAMTSSFLNCSSLNSVDIRSMTTWDTNKARGWLYRVAPTGTIYINSAIDGVIPENDTSGIPSRWTKVVVNQ